MFYETILQPYNHNESILVILNYKLGGHYLNNLMKKVQELKHELETSLKDFIEMINDDVYYVEYSQDNIDELLASLVDHGYVIGDDIWNDHEFFSHLLVDHTLKKVQLIQGNWLRYVKELDYTIHPVDTLIELLPFHE